MTRGQEGERRGRGKGKGEGIGGEESERYSGGEGGERRGEQACCEGMQNREGKVRAV